ncbi:ABC transporter permease [Leucobacter soli]|uniref:D,D-dipeptide transport system permease protein DdpC n=1 Tax=Leucobacter soli TaxID=2812850 RepID=A0A916NGM9_9MICO|nr:ABC transporter permease [Leucobacter soli]CAG7608727.1 putative D,D-dipeptide transport system permease protein DdpC [Leucobacter soli]
MSQDYSAVSPETTTSIPRPGERRRMKMRATWNVAARILRMPLFAISLSIVLVWVVVIVFADQVAPFDPSAQLGVRLSPPTGEYLFGTDELGRDVFSRVVHGARISLVFAVILVAAAMIIGTLLGMVSGFFGGRVDEVLMRLVDLFFAFPVIILAMAVAAALGASVQNAVLAGVIVSWPIYARMSRGLVVGYRDAEFVISSRLAGMSSTRSIAVDLIPSVAGPMLVLATQDVGAAILLLASLSFLGVGAQPPMPEWGAMISAGMTHFNAWWIAVFPGLAIVTVALAFNLLGDGLRDLFDPKMKRSVQRRVK